LERRRDLDHDGQPDVVDASGPQEQANTATTN
jgi:hypothetical protein